jgi:hypothetical protein
MNKFDELMKSGRFDEAVRAGELDDMLVSGGRFDAIAGNRFDANETIFLQRELTLIESQLYRVVYPGLKARQFFPVMNAGAGLQSLGYHQMDVTGKAKIKGSKTKDNPRVGLKKEEFLHKVRHLTLSYGWDYHELKEAARAGMPLESEQAMAAREIMERTIDEMAFIGDSTYDVPGFFTNGTDYNEYLMPADGTSSSKKIINKTADLIVRDLNGLLNKVITGSKGVYRPNALLLPIDAYAHIMTTPRSSTSDTTIAQFLIANNPGLQIDTSYNLNSVTATFDSATFTNKGMAIAYYRSPDVLKLQLPEEFTTLPVQQNGWNYDVLAYCDIAGLFVYKPIAVAVAGDA